MMKKILLASVFIGLFSISCERVSDNISDNVNVSDNFLVGTWDLIEESDDGGNSWDEYTFTDVYIEFRDDGTFTENVGGTENHFHYQLCKNEELYRWKLQDANSESFVNQNCNCGEHGTKYIVNAARTLFQEWGCTTNGDHREKYEKR